MADGDARLQVVLDAKIDQLIDKLGQAERKLGAFSASGVGAASRLRAALDQTGKVDLNNQLKLYELQNKLTVQRLAGNKTEAAALEEQILLIRQVNDLKRIGVEETVAQGIAERQIVALRAARAHGHVEEGLGTGLAAAGAGIRGAVFEEGAASLGAAGGALEAIGPAGFAAAAGVAALALAVEQAKGVAEWAESLEKASKALGISTSALQEFDFVANATGIPVDKMRESLKGVNAVIGQVQKGVVGGKTKKIFDALDISQEQLRNLGDLQHVLPLLLDKLDELPASERAGLATRLKIDPEVLNALIEAKDRLGGLIAEAHKFGIIADEALIKKAADAGEKLHIASEVIDKEMKVAFADLAGPIATATLKFAEAVSAIADMVRGIKDAIGWVGQLVNLLNKVPGLHANAGEIGEKIKIAAQFANPAIMGAVGLARLARQAGAEDRGSQSLQLGIAAVREGLLSKHGLTDTPLPPTGGSKGNGPEVAKEVRDKLDTAIKDLATAMAALTGDIFAHAQLEKDAVDAELKKQQDDFTAERVKVASAKGLSAAAKRSLAAELDQAQTKEEQAAQAKKDKIDRDAAAKFEESIVADAQAVDRYYQELAPILERRAKTLKAAQAIEESDLLRRQTLERQDLKARNNAAEGTGAQSASQSAALVAAQADLQKGQRDELTARQSDALTKQENDLIQIGIDTKKASLQHELSIADSLSQRRRIMLDQLALDEQQERIAQQQIIDSQSASAAEKELAKARLQQIDDLHAGKVADIAFQTKSPVQAFQREGNQALGQDNLQTQFVQALGEMNSGLADAIVNAKSLGDVGKAVFKQLEADLITDLLKAAESKLLSGIFGTLLGIPGFAEGTQSAPGGLALVGERGPELVNLRRGAQVIPNHTLSLLRTPSVVRSAGGGVTVLQPITFDAKGAVMTSELVADFNRKIAISQQQAVATALTVSRRQLNASNQSDNLLKN